MIKCNHCNELLPDNSNFCTSCGAEITSESSTPSSAATVAKSLSADGKNILQNAFAPSNETVRSIPIAIILSIVTCGIYAFFWIYRLNREVNQAAGKFHYTGGAIVLLLTFLTCGLYSIYWNYQMGVNIEVLKQNLGKPSGSTPIIYLLLSIFGFGIISLALMQNELNDFYLGQ